MSQLFKSILARGFLVHRALATQTHHISHLPCLAFHTPKRLFVSQSPPSKFSQAKTNLDTTNEFDFDDQPEIKLSKSYGYNKHFKSSNFNNRFNNRLNNRTEAHRKTFDQSRSEDYEGREQVGLEDAEPVECSKQAADNFSEQSSFEKYNLPDELMSRMKELGYDRPFEIQEATLMQSLEGRDLVGRAFTGSGKTLAFAIPIISKILNSPNRSSRNPKCLILSPTRELCLQLQTCIQELAPYLKCLAIYGGTDYNSQVMPLRGKVDIVCATPGRLRDLMSRGTFVTNDIETVCLDEADELLNPQFQEQIQDVIELSNKKQMLMFSATINKNVVELVKKYMKNPVFVDLTKGQRFKLPANIEHCLVRCEQRDPTPLISHYISEYAAEKCIVFTKTKKQADYVNRQLRINGHKSSDLHSDYSQYKRSQILSKFRAGQLRVLVATDVAARGLDIPEINVVVQLGFPANGIEYYIHRSGRCGRAGRLGTSILIDDGEMKIDRDLFRLIKFTKLNVPDSIASQADEPRDFDSYSRKSSYNTSPVRKNGYDREFKSMDYKKQRSYQERESFNGFNKYNNNNGGKYGREEEEY